MYTPHRRGRPMEAALAKAQPEPLPKVLVVDDQPAT